MSSFKHKLSGLWRSITFRLTLNYGLLAILTTLILLVFIYFQMMGVLHTQQFRHINRAAHRMTIVFEEGGRDALVRAIDTTLLDRLDLGSEAYLLLDEHGEKLAGNLNRSFASQLVPSVFEANTLLNGQPITGHFKAHELPDGSVLVVGQDAVQIDEVSAMIVQAIVAAIILAVLLVILGTYVFRRELEHRVSFIRRTALKIGAGQLSQRVPLSTAPDEFTHLNRDINTMLDKLEILMKGVRHVCDTIAHNLRTPLTRIVGRLRDAQRKEAVGELLAANEFAIAEIEKLDTLFGKLLQIAEIEAGVRRQTFRPCRLDVIVSDVVEMYEALAEERGVTIDLHVAGPAPVNGDADLLASACANLLDNAIKYAKSRIGITVASDGGQSEVVFSDDGPGLQPADYARLGEHFYRPDPASEGHGLGLTSVSAIVSLHDGYVRFSAAQSDAKGLKAALGLPTAFGLLLT